MTEGMIQLTDANFDTEISRNDTPILVDFWAVWCGPCKMVAPELEKLHEEKKDILRIGKLNVDENREIAIRYSITSIPTLLLFKGGQVLAKIIGAMPKDKILIELANYL
jgi:thioredoxin 1